jgi:hypothetical protein
MKTKNIYRIVMVLAGLVMLALAACGDLTGPGTGGEAIPEGMGLARINLGKGGARTALPDIGGSYYFTLEFTAPGKTAVSKTLNGGTSVTVALEPAFWNLEVRGYTDSGMTSLKVRGSAAAAVIAGTESRFDVDLTPDFSSGEKGSLVYSISFPASVSRGFLGLYPLDVPGYREEIGEIDVSLPVDRTGTITDLPEGSYRAVIELYDGEHNKAAAWTGAAHIYGGAATTLTRTFTAANFTGCPPVIGTGLTSLADKLDAALAAPLGSYTIVLDGNETDLESFNSKNLIATEDKAIIIRGNGNEVQLGGDGYLFNLNSWGSQMADLSLELHDLTLRGLESNSVCLVFVRNRGILKMRAGSLITGNSVSANTGCGGVYVDSGGTFTMSGGAVSGNSVSSSFSSSFYNTVGGGVAIISGTFIMSGGTISGNSVSSNGPSSESGGGGVCVFGGTFTMSGGAVSGNSAFVRSITSHGGGV